MSEEPAISMTVTPAPEELTSRGRGRPRKQTLDVSVKEEEEDEEEKEAQSAPKRSTRKRILKNTSLAEDDDDNVEVDGFGNEAEDEPEFEPLRGEGPSDKKKATKRRKSAASNYSNSVAGDGASLDDNANRELLSEEQKKLNHIQSEKKRRQNIRAGFEQLVDMVPELKEGLGKGVSIKNEALILSKSHEHIEELKQTRQEIQRRILQFRQALGEGDDMTMMEDSEDDELDEDGNPRQAPARLVQIQHMAQQVLNDSSLPSADLVFQLAAEGRLSSTTPKLEATE